MKHLCLCLFITTCGLLTPARAAVITWSAPQNVTSATTEVSTTGTLDRAYNFTTTTGSTTVNTVVFSNLTDGNHNVSGVHTYSAVGSSSTVSTQSYPGTSTPFSGLDSSYQDLLRSFVTVGGASPNPNSYTLNLLNLQPGYAYQLQIWVSDSRTNAPAGNGFLNASSVVGGGTAVDYNTGNAGGSLGQYVTGTFVADATSQSYTFYSAVSAGTAFFTPLNAYQLRITAVPEPGVSLLSGLGLAMVAFRRRRSA